MSNSLLWKSVSIHPYFKIHPGKLEACKKVLRDFVNKTKSESGNRFYEFTINGETVFCRESYLHAEAALTHLENVGPEIEAMLKVTDLIRLEIHGPDTELQKLKGPLAHLNPEWYAWECGVER